MMSIENFNPENFNSRRSTTADAIRAVQYFAATLSTDKNVREKLDDLRYELVENGRSDLSRALKTEGYEVVDYDNFHALTEGFLLKALDRSQSRFDRIVTDADIDALEAKCRTIEAEYGFDGFADGLYDNVENTRRMMGWFDEEELVLFFRAMCNVVTKS